MSKFPQKCSRILKKLIVLVTLLLVMFLLAGTSFAEDKGLQTFSLDPFENSALVATDRYDLAETVIILREDSADVAASVLAGAFDAPILLTESDALPEIIAAAIEKLGARKAIVIGGEKAVSPHVFEELVNLDLEVTRIGGIDRYETAAKISEIANHEVGLADKAIIVNGLVLPDALVASSAAFKNRMPVLLVTRDKVPSVTKKAIEDLGTNELYIVGGNAVVSEEVESVLAEVAQVERLGGANRYGTSIAFAEGIFEDLENFVITDGRDVHLSEAVSASIYGLPVILVQRDRPPDIVLDYLERVITEQSEIKAFGATCFLMGMILDNHPDRQPLLQSPTAGWVAKAIAQGALKEVGGELMGRILDDVGLLNDDDPNMQRLKQDLDKIQKELTEIKKMLDQLAYELKASEYNTAVRIMQDFISSVNYTRGLLADYADSPSQLEKERIITLIERDILGKDTYIHDHLIGTPTSKGLLQLWNEIVYQSRFLTQKDHEKLVTMIEYYHQLQESVLLLQVEYYHTKENKDEEETRRFVNKLIDQHNERIEEQYEVLGNEIPVNIVVDTKLDLMLFEYGGFLVNGRKEPGVPNWEDNWYLNEFTGYNDWRHIDTSIFFNKFTAGFNQSSESLMCYLERNGWYPSFTGANMYIYLRIPNPDQNPQTPSHFITQRSVPKLVNKWEFGVSNYYQWWIIYREMPEQEWTQYYYK